MLFIFNDKQNNKWGRKRNDEQAPSICIYCIYSYTTVFYLFSIYNNIYIPLVYPPPSPCYHYYRQSRRTTTTTTQLDLNFFVPPPIFTFPICVLFSVSSRQAERNPSNYRQQYNIIYVVLYPCSDEDPFSAVFYFVFITSLTQCRVVLSSPSVYTGTQKPIRFTKTLHKKRGASILYRNKKQACFWAPLPSLLCDRFFPA